MKSDIQVDSGHKQLERIHQKEINDISLRNQKIRLTRQRCDLNVNSILGRGQLLADALSVGYIEDYNLKEKQIHTLLLLFYFLSFQYNI